MTTIPQPDAEDSDDERLLLAFRAVTSPIEMIRLAAGVDAAALDALEQNVERTLADLVASDDANSADAALRERLESLREIRQQDVAALAAQLESATVAVAQHAQALADRLVAWIQTPGWDASEAFLQEHADELLTDASAATLQMLQEANQGSQEIALHINLLAACQEQGIAADYAQLHQELAAAIAQGLADRLVAWIQTPDWEASEVFINEHTAELLTDAGAATLELLQEANEGNEQIALHTKLLAACRQQGIAAAYVQLRQELAAAASREALANNPLFQAVIEFLQAENDEAALSILTNRRNLLLTLDAQRHLEGFLAAARQQDNGGEAQTRFEARLALWQVARQAQARGPLRSQAVDGQPADPQPREWQEQRQPESEATWRQNSSLQGDSGARYVVVNAHNSAIGDNASVLNIFTVGELPLQWRRPEETRSTLAGRAVGREAELAELHHRLQTEGGAAIVGVGTATAVRGQPGIGKTVLAAMYAQRYGQTYAGGILWLDVGPGRRTTDDVTALLQRIATYAYDANAQAQLLAECIFAPDTVRALLSGHGPMLIILDDVWTEEVVYTLRSALPADSTIILTTRDYDVAFALEERTDAIQELDVLTAVDARLLLQSKAPTLPTPLADRLAQGLGYHALALTLAAGALPRRKASRYEQTAVEILAQVANGHGFGDLPRMDKADRVSRVEEVLKYSYDYLGTAGDDGAQRQGWFRALGVFAQESSFTTSVAGALWQTTEETAEGYLLELDGLGLLQELENIASSETRWQQHAILRAYALSLQRAEERLHWPELHADYYLTLARECNAEKPRAYDRVALEFKQIEQAFGWCRQASLARTISFTETLDDFMRNRGYAVQLHAWLQFALDAAQQIGSRLGRANTLQSLGDLERRLGNIELARQHYDAALPLYEAEQARLGRANTLKSLGDLERRLGNIELARQHYDAALTLYELEQDPVGKMNTLISLARMAVGQGQRENAFQWYEQVFTLAEQISFTNHPVVTEWRQEYATLRSTDIADQPHNAMVQMLIAWIQTPNWNESEAYLSQHTDDLLTDEANTVLQLLQQANEGNEQIALHVNLLAACREQGIAAAYAQLHRELQAAALRAQVADLPAAEERLLALLTVNDVAGMMQLVINTEAAALDETETLATTKLAELDGDAAAALRQRLESLRQLRQQDPQQLAAQWGVLQQAAQDPVTQALTALFQVTDSATLGQVLEAHPLLLTYPALARLTAVIEQAHASGQSDAATHPLTLLSILLEQYNYRHTAEIEPTEQQAIIELYTRLLPTADAVDRAQLGAPLRRNGGWALNTLGNHYAQGDQHQAAVDAYSRGLEVDGQNAMLYRNRAGERIALGDYAEAQQDIEMAGQLEPEAARLPQLWCELYATQSDSQALITEAGAWSIRQPENAQPHFYLALAALLTGDTTQGQTALAQVLSLANADDRQSFRETLARLQAQWPDQQVALQQMLEQFQEETP